MTGLARVTADERGDRNEMLVDNLREQKRRLIAKEGRGARRQEAQSNEKEEEME